MTLGQPRQQGQVEKSPGSALAILLGLLIAGGLALFALARKPAPPQPVQVTPAPQSAPNPQASWPQTGPSTFSTPPAPLEPPAPK